MHDLVIRGATVIDGSGGPRYTADVAVNDWKIAAISTHTVGRFRAANPALDDMPIAVCRPGAPALPVAAAAHIGGRYALIVGRMNSRERYKGHDMLIEVWPIVRRSVPDARLVIAGDGDDVERLRAKAADGIEFAGRVDEPRLAALYRDATFFVMPSTDGDPVRARVTDPGICNRQHARRGPGNVAALELPLICD